LCRLVALAAREPRLTEIVSIVEALIEASRHDPRLERVSGGSRHSHDDGWGLAALAIVRRGSSKKVGYVYERSSLPIFDPLSIRTLTHLVRRSCRCEELYMVIHSRAASRGEPLGSEAAHPYREVIDSRGAIWFAHNGSADKDALARELGVSPALHTDSELLAMYIACELRAELSRRGRLDEPSRLLTRIVRSAVERFCRDRAVVSALLVYLDGYVGLYATTYVPSDERRLEYYRPYVISSSGLSAVVSPTVADALESRGFKAREARLNNIAKIIPGSVEWLGES